MKEFSAFPQFVDRHSAEWRGKQVLMYCTGGIRCEKASAYVKSKGLDDVAQLAGGIHRYLEEFPDGGFFKGKNFVFDQRGALGSTNQSIVGRCLYCDCPYDRLAASRVCTVCRDLVLVCSDVREMIPLLLPFAVFPSLNPAIFVVLLCSAAPPHRGCGSTASSTARSTPTGSPATSHASEVSLTATYGSNCLSFDRAGTHLAGTALGIALEIASD